MTSPRSPPILNSLRGFHWPTEASNSRWEAAMNRTLKDRKEIVRKALMRHVVLQPPIWFFFHLFSCFCWLESPPKPLDFRQQKTPHLATAQLRWTCHGFTGWNCPVRFQCQLVPSFTLRPNPIDFFGHFSSLEVYMVHCAVAFKKKRPILLRLRISDDCPLSEFGCPLFVHPVWNKNNPCERITYFLHVLKIPPLPSVTIERVNQRI